MPASQFRAPKPPKKSAGVVLPPGTAYLSLAQSANGTLTGTGKVKMIIPQSAARTDLRSALFVVDTNACPGFAPDSQTVDAVSLAASVSILTTVYAPLSVGVTFAVYQIKCVQIDANGNGISNSPTIPITEFDVEASNVANALGTPTPEPNLEFWCNITVVGQVAK